MPLKVLWAFFDVVTIVVLGSGLYLWLRRNQGERPTVRAQRLSVASSTMEPAE